MWKITNSNTGNVTEATRAPMNNVLLFGVPAMAAIRVMIYKLISITIVIRAKIRFINIYPFRVKCYIDDNIMDIFCQGLLFTK